MTFVGSAGNLIVVFGIGLYGLPFQTIPRGASVTAFTRRQGDQIAKDVVIIW